MNRRAVLAFALAILCVLFAAASATGQGLTHGQIIGGGTVVYLAVSVPRTDVPMAVDYIVNQAIGRTVWVAGTDWALLPIPNPCAPGQGGSASFGLVTVCPPRPEGGAMDACVLPGVLPIYNETPSIRCVSRRRAVRR